MEDIVSEVFQAFGAAAALLTVIALISAKYLGQWFTALVSGRVDRQVKERLAQQQHDFNRELEQYRQELALHTGTALERAKRAEDRRAEAERLVGKFRGPLLQAAYDLQSRIYNIVHLTLLPAYVAHGTKEEREYSVENTLYLVAQYFAWTEIIRREGQFLDLGGEVQSRKLSELQDTITHLWRTDASGFGREFRLFAGDQRAVGERMLRDGAQGAECLGYADFRDLIAGTPDRIPQLQGLRSDLLWLAKQHQQNHPRLVHLQNAYVDLLLLLDPAYTWYPESRRGKLSVTTVT